MDRLTVEGTTSKVSPFPSNRQHSTFAAYGTPVPKKAVPTISQFYGITIRMYFDDHPPPHFHAYYGSEAA